MKRYIIEVSDSALMHMCLMGLESYCIPRVPKETYGLLWGISTHKPEDEHYYDRTHYRIDHVMTDIEAMRTKGDVAYNRRNIKLKKQIVEECWPSLSLLGDFHTHPYRNRSEVPSIIGLSEGDRRNVEEDDRKFWFDMEFEISLVMTIFLLEKDGWKEAGEVSKKSHIIQWTLRNYDWKKYYRLQLAAYVMNKVEGGRRKSLILMPREDDWEDERIEQDIPEHEVRLDIPSVLGTYNFR